MMDKIDTSTLGPIKVDPNKDAMRAQIVHNAINSLCNNPRITQNERLCFSRLSVHLTDATAALLGRMLK